MKLIIAVLFLSLLRSAGLGQAVGLPQTDSLKHLLAKANQDPSRVLLLAQISESFRSSHPDSAWRYSQQALQLARQISFSKGEILALLSWSVVQRELGHHPKALEAALNALKLAQEHRLKDQEGFALVRVGNVYVANKEFDKAVPFFQQALKLFLNPPDGFWLAVIPILLGGAFEQMNQLDSAWHYGNIAYKRMAASETLHPGVLTTLGNVQAKWGNDQQALAYYRSAAKAASAGRDFRHASTTFIKMASLYKRRNQIDSAIFYAKKGLAMGEKLSYPNQVLAASNLLADLYEPQDPKEALRYYKLASAAKDTLYSAEKVQALQSLVFEEQERQRESEKAKTDYQNKVRQYVLQAGIGVVLIIALLLYRNNLHK